MSDNDYWVSGRTEQEALEKAAKKFKVPISKVTLKQDEDVLDTWFSSGLFPFSIFGWPDQTDDLKAFYPGSLLETGHDILFFWVARMVFFGQKLLGRLPFKQVYLHPIVRDAHGRKMSKSLGNVIDPMDVIYGITLDDLHKQLLESNLDSKEVEKAKLGQKQDYPDGIPECGTDALRFALCAMCQGRDINLDILRVQGYRFFCNKIWNATKFALNYLGNNFVPPNNNLHIEGESLMDQWMLSRIASAVVDINKGFEGYEFSLVTTTIYSLWLYELCDVYLEHLKPIFAAGRPKAISIAQATLYRALEVSLRLLSPLMPFITEELYQRLPRLNSDKEKIQSICVVEYPKPADCSWRNKEIEGDVEFVQKIAKAIRSTRSDYNLPNKTKTEAYLKCSDPQTEVLVKNYIPVLQTLAYCSKVELNTPAPQGCTILTISNKCEVNLLLKGLIDPSKELGKLQKKVDFLEATKNKLTQAIDSADYSTKVPLEVQETNSEKLAQTNTELERLRSAVDSLKLIEQS